MSLLYLIFMLLTSQEFESEFPSFGPCFHGIMANGDRSNSPLLSRIFFFFTSRISDIINWPVDSSFQSFRTSWLKNSSALSFYINSYNSLFRVSSSGSDGKECACHVEDLSLIPGLGRSPEEKGYPLQYSGLENSMGYIVHGVSKSWTGLSDFHWHWLVMLRIFHGLIGHS